MPRVLGLIEPRHHGRDHPAHHAVGGLQHGDVESGFAAGGRHFEADVATADDHGAPPGRELGAQPVDVGDAAQVVHAGELGARHRQQARMAAGGQQQPVVLHGAAVGDLDAARARSMRTAAKPSRMSTPCSA